jgi:hypothetical protein
MSACRKAPEPTVPRPPDSNIAGGGSVQELPGSTLFHTIYRYAGHASQVLRFYEPEMQKRGARLSGQSYVHDNMVSSGGSLKDSIVRPKDSAQPGVYLAVVELPEATYVDVWENVPK